MTDARQIKAVGGKRCITAAEGNAVISACSSDDANQRWLVVSDHEQ